MNHPKQRSRGRGNPNVNGKIRHSGGGGGGGGGGRNQIFDSNGPDGRIRGNANQVMERYLALARDSASQGDRVMAENCYQHAEHYFRLLNAYGQSVGQRRPFGSSTPAEDQAEMPDPDDEQPSMDGDDEDQGGDDEMDADAQPEAAVG